MTYPTTGTFPAELMLGRSVKIKLPEMSKPRPSDASVRITKERAERVQYEDKCSHVESTAFRIGDQVLVRQPRHRK